MPRIVGTVAVGSAIVIALTLAYVFQNVSQSLDNAEERELKSVFTNVRASIEAQGAEARAMSVLVAGIPRAQKAMAEGDRDTLAAMFLPGFATLKKAYGVRQFQFHTPPATSFYRVHKPKKFGDDLSGFRKTVVETNNTRQPIQGLEVGVAGLGVRGMVPMTYQGKHTGSVEFGMSFGQAFFDDYTAAHGTKLALHLMRDGKFDPFASTLGRESMLDPDELRQIFDARKGAFHTAELGGVPVGVYADIVTDYSGNPIGVLQVVQDRSFYLSQLNWISGVMLLAAILSIAVSGVLVWVVARNVVKPLKLATGRMREIASGDADLGAKLEVDGKDEVADLADGFNRFVATIRELVEEVSSSVVTIGTSTEALAGVAEHTSRGIQQQQSETTQIATAMTQMSSTVHDVANNTSEAAEAASQADKQAEEGRQVVKVAATTIEGLAKDVQTAVGSVRQVNEDSLRIATVLEVIRGIAEQTNLLALNAAIEAARAGEQGRGFAVVADEVRQLAHRTQESTKEIQDMIQALQSSVGQTVTVMEGSQTRAVESVEQATRVADVLAEITSSMDTISQMTAQIATASEEQSHVAEDINRSVVSISHVAEQTTEDAHQTSAASSQLASSVENLMDLVGRFQSSGGGNLRPILEQAKARHLAWKTKVRRFLDGEEQLDEKVAFDEHGCSLGKWLDAEGWGLLSHVPEARELERPHRELHQTIRKIADLKEQGNLDAAEREYQRVAPLSHEIVSVIDNILSKL